MCAVSAPTSVVTAEWKALKPITDLKDSDKNLLQPVGDRSK
ncbi:hypothetical protein PJE062_2760 [Pseudovibrio sp. JE062]|nr:hypothetical protein PJE062_2760 [Pseudovibrio sp. JE062]